VKGILPCATCPRNFAVLPAARLLADLDADSSVVLPRTGLICYFNLMFLAFPSLLARWITWGALLYLRWLVLYPVLCATTSTMQWDAFLSILQFSFVLLLFLFVATSWPVRYVIGFFLSLDPCLPRIPPSPMYLNLSFLYPTGKGACRALCRIRVTEG
jgi:hypothetical protein